jgi:serine phosphatase RsbU (regulator of sigma subunit)
VPLEQTFSEIVVEVEPGLKLYMTTDGIIDQIGGDRRRAFGKRRFTELLSELHELPMARQEEYLSWFVQEFQGDEIRRDDVSAIGVRLH